MQAFSLSGENPIQIGGSFSFLTWTLDGRTALLGGSYFVPLPVGESLPRIPQGGGPTRKYRTYPVCNESQKTESFPDSQPVFMRFIAAQFSGICTEFPFRNSRTKLRIAPD